MQLISFKDSCVITRNTGAFDEWDNPVQTTIYEGACLYEEGRVGYTGKLAVRTPMLFLPSNDVLVNINDSVKITTEAGREITSVARSVRDIRLSVMAVSEITQIALKQAQGD